MPEKAKIRRVAKQLRAIVEDMELYKANPTAAFELMAEQFYRDTGYIAPGKSLPPEMSTVDYDQERHERYKEWLERRWYRRLTVLKGAIEIIEGTVDDGVSR